MFLVTSIINYFIFIVGVKKVIVPIKNNYVSDYNYLYFKQIYNLFMSFMSSYLFYSGLNVYNEVKLLTNSENVLTNIYSPLKIETESFKYLLPIIIISKYLEWIDTALIILDGKNPGLLHLFHHANIVGGFYYGCYTSSYFVTGFLNSFVHIIMYLYYSKIFPNINKRVAKNITQLQIVQLGLITLFSAKGLISPIDMYDFYVTIYIEICVIINLGLFINYYKDRYINKLKNK